MTGRGAIVLAGFRNAVALCLVARFPGLVRRARVRYATGQQGANGSSNGQCPGIHSQQSLLSLFTSRRAGLHSDRRGVGSARVAASDYATHGEAALSLLLRAE